jgi:predicted HD phosphohydrolase
MLVLDETAAMLRSLRGVWDEEAVDELDHALQCAARAIADGADDELALAAALHDLGHSPLLDAQAYEHPDSAARVGWLAGAHVAAKRYLAATEPGYELSEASVSSLRAQGGAAVDPGWLTHPWWPDALRLRHYDDAAKDPAARGATIDDVMAIAERVMRQRDPSWGAQ